MPVRLIFFFLKWPNMCCFHSFIIHEDQSMLLGINFYPEEATVLGASLYFQPCRLESLQKWSVVPQFIPKLVWCS
jgi:hypothetical protein